MTDMSSIFFSSLCRIRSQERRHGQPQEPILGHRRRSSCPTIRRVEGSRSDLYQLVEQARSWDQGSSGEWPCRRRRREWRCFNDADHVASFNRSSHVNAIATIASLCVAIVTFPPPSPLSLSMLRHCYLIPIFLPMHHDPPRSPRHFSHLPAPHLPTSPEETGTRPKRSSSRVTPGSSTKSRIPVFEDEVVRGSLPG